MAYCDCQSVVNLERMPLRRALDGRRMHAGIFKHAVGQESRHWLRETVKVKAHIIEPGQEVTIPDLEQRRHAIGNNLADLAAKQGLQAHPGPSFAEAESAAQYVRKLTEVYPSRPGSG